MKLRLIKGTSALLAEGTADDIYLRLECRRGVRTWFMFDVDGELNRMNTLYSMELDKALEEANHED